MKFVIEEKDAAEIVTATFPYAKELAGAQISGAVITNTVLEGADPAAAAMLSGAPEIVQGDVLQRLINGVPGVRYKLKCLATLSDGRKLARVLLIAARNF